MRRLWVVLLLGVFSLGWARVDHDIVGKWRTPEDFRGDKIWGEVGCEIEFRRNGRFVKRSDEGDRLQLVREGRFLISFAPEGDRLELRYSKDTEPLEVMVLVFEDEMEVWKGGSRVRFERSDEPVEKLRALPGLPKTVDEAVALLASEMSEGRKYDFATRPEWEFIGYHFSWGMGIRNRFRLWSGNRKLLESCGSSRMDPDRASGIILEALRERLRKEMDPKRREAVDRIHKGLEEIEVLLDGVDQSSAIEVVERLNAAVRARFVEGSEMYFTIELFSEGDRLNAKPLLRFSTERSYLLYEVVKPLVDRLHLRITYLPGRVILSEWL